jgi:hypothetical protein
MWQRIQTLFLVIVIASLIASLFFPIWMYNDPLGQSHGLFPLHYTVTQNEVKNTDYYPYALTAILAIAAATLAIIEIRKFKDRVLQMKLGALNSLFIAGTIACAVIFSNQLVKNYQGGSYGLALWLPGVAVICNLLANRFIRRDERLVRESDRLR